MFIRVDRVSVLIHPCHKRNHNYNNIMVMGQVSYLCIMCSAKINIYIKDYYYKPDTAILHFVTSLSCASCKPDSGCSTNNNCVVVRYMHFMIRSIMQSCTVFGIH